VTYSASQIEIRRELMDARQRKTRAALATAVLELSSERSIAEVTVSQIAALAGVHRSTFYEFAGSPIDLLQTVLRSELDTVRERYLVDVDPTRVSRAIVDTTDAVLEHVEQHEAIYRRGLGNGSGGGSLHELLSAHFEQSTRLLLAQHSIRIPDVPGVEAETVRDAVARYVADGTVGAIEVWLRTPVPRDRAAFLRLFSVLVPGWWPR
jgi:AcrR family transcriptional regulator